MISCIIVWTLEQSKVKRWKSNLSTCRLRYINKCFSLLHFDPMTSYWPFKKNLHQMKSSSLKFSSFLLLLWVKAHKLENSYYNKENSRAIVCLRRKSFICLVSLVIVEFTITGAYNLVQLKRKRLCNGFEKVFFQSPKSSSFHLTAKAPQMFIWLLLVLLSAHKLQLLGYADSIMPNR